MRNLAFQLAYDGTHFVGSQSQKTGRTIQDEVERAWQRFTGETRRWTLAGRTDAGVHANGQVANVLTETAHALTTVQRALNALLPPDVVVREVWDVETEFHARFSATRRDYCYTILHERWGVPSLRSTTWHIATRLDLAAMQQAAALLVGEHDFAAFGVVDAGPTTRRCESAGWRTTERDGHPLVVFEVAANGFLRHMVRALVGMLVEVGRGNVSISGFGDILASCERNRATQTAPPQGLNLMRITYPEPFGIFVASDGQPPLLKANHDD